MSEYLISETTLTGIADAIREKKGTAEPVPVTEMGMEILGLTVDTFATLPPPVSAVTAAGADRSVEVTFEPVAADYEPYLGGTAYVIVLKEGSIPQNPEDGIVIKMDKNGAVIG